MPSEPATPAAPAAKAPVPAVAAGEPAKPVKAPARSRAQPSVWALRSAIPVSAGRVASIVSVLVLVLAWCAMSYIEVERNGQSVPLVPHFFLPAPDQVIKSLFYL